MRRRTRSPESLGAKLRSGEGPPQERWKDFLWDRAGKLTLCKFSHQNAGQAEQGHVLSGREGFPIR